MKCCVLPRALPLCRFLDGVADPPFQLYRKSKRHSRMLSEARLEEGRLCIVGNINRDIKTAPLASGERLLRDGETPVSSIYETIGGGGANSACAAVSLGAKVAFLGKIGTDSLGERLERTLLRHGFVARLRRDADVPTGNSLAL